MVGVTEDQNTAEQVFQSFREVAEGKPYVTELDLRHSLIPDELIEDLCKTMPLSPDKVLEEEADVQGKSMCMACNLKVTHTFAYTD